MALCGERETSGQRQAKDPGQPAGGGPAPQAPGPASPAGRDAGAGRTQLGRDGRTKGTQAPTFAHVAAWGAGGGSGGGQVATGRLWGGASL
jgi:hypothetical protein